MDDIVASLRKLDARREEIVLQSSKKEFDKRKLVFSSKLQELFKKIEKDVGELVEKFLHETEDLTYTPSDFSNFFSEELIEVDNLMTRITSGEAFDRYTSWSKEHHTANIGKEMFGKEMALAGYRSIPSHSTRYHIGLCLRPLDDPTRTQKK